MNPDLIPQLVALAQKAADAILEIYNSDDFEIQTKSDESPLTKADLAANNIIVEGLKQITPEIPIVSEENDTAENAAALKTPKHWMIDPVDGTKEFIKRNGEFTVNIGLIEYQKPAFGVVVVPVTATTYYGGEEFGAFKVVGNEKPQKISVSPMAEKIRVVVSRSHLGIKEQAFAAQYGEFELIETGSSIKTCLVAEGAADVYPRFKPLSQWDISAADAVLRGAGGAIYSPDTQAPYVYNDDIIVPKLLAKSHNT